jgi:ferredoxin
MSRSKITYNLLMKVWPWGKAVNWLGDKPLVGTLVRPCFGSEENEAIIIPVDEMVGGTESVVLPFSLLTPLIEGASARVVLNECLCRRGENCQVYPHELGCIFLGDGAAEIAPHLGRSVEVDEALDHVRQAMDAELAPLVVHAAFDAWMLGIPYRRTLAVCFCCDCCCSVRQGLRLGPPAFWGTVVRLPGLSVTVGPACTGCEICLDVCHVAAITLEGGLARIGDACKGCGRCAAVCPAGAISLHVAEEVDVLGQLLARIEQRTDIGLGGTEHGK